MPDQPQNEYPPARSANFSRLLDVRIEAKPDGGLLIFFPPQAWQFTAGLSDGGLMQLVISPRFQSRSQAAPVVVADVPETSAVAPHQAPTETAARESGERAAMETGVISLAQAGRQRSEVIERFNARIAKFRAEQERKQSVD